MCSGPSGMPDGGVKEMRPGITDGGYGPRPSAGMAWPGLRPDGHGCRRPVCWVNVSTRTPMVTCQAPGQRQHAQSPSSRPRPPSPPSSGRRPRSGRGSRRASRTGRPSGTPPIATVFVPTRRGRQDDAHGSIAHHRGAARGAHAAMSLVAHVPDVRAGQREHRGQDRDARRGWPRPRGTGAASGAGPECRPGGAGPRTPGSPRPPTSASLPPRTSIQGEVRPPARPSLRFQVSAAPAAAMATNANPARREKRRSTPSACVVADRRGAQGEQHRRRGAQPGHRRQQVRGEQQPSRTGRPRCARRRPASPAPQRDRTAGRPRRHPPAAARSPAARRAPR